MNKNYIVMVALVVLLGAGTYLLLTKNNPAPAAQTPTVAVDETVAPAPAPVATQTPGTYTLADVATHASAASCWTAVNGSVYDVTSWINKHPGGAMKILSMCGKDASAAFDRQHGGQSRPESELAGFKIGVLAS